MIKVLARLFIKDYKNVKDNNVRSAYGVLCAVFGIVTNLLICAFKIIVGIISGAISIMADGINNLTDGGSSIITLVGFKLANKPADKDHPFGHERIEYVNGLIVSLVILIIGVLLVKTSIEKIINPTDINLDYFWIAIIALSVSILVKLWQNLFYNKCAKLIDSPALKATAKDSLADILSTSVVLVSLIVAKIWNLQIDGYIGLLVAGFIIFNAIKLIIETSSPLIGEAPDKDFVKMVENKILSYEGVLGIHDLVIHSYGQAKTFISVHVEVNADVDILISHDIVDNIEHDFMEENINLVVHMDPVRINDPETNKLKAVVATILNEIDTSLSFHDFRVVHGPTHSNILFDVVVPTAYNKKDEELISLINSKVKEVNDNYNVIITIDRNYIGGKDE